jgi:chromate reductase, NAD(P)H dehydrogenase (quinone)
MKSLTVICGTNRDNSFTHKVSLYYQKILQNKGIESKLLTMSDMPKDIAFGEVFGKRSGYFDDLIRTAIEPCDHFILISPEYNGSFPGILKVFIDAVHPSKWHDKKFCLTGVSSGRAGNLRGMEHLTNILNYLKVHVYHNKLPISQIDKIFEGTEPSSEETIQAIDKQIDGFLKF